MIYLTIKETAELLGVTTSRVYDLIRSGKLPAAKQRVKTDRMFIRKNDLGRYIKNRRPAGRPKKKVDKEA